MSQPTPHLSLTARTHRAWTRALCAIGLCTVTACSFDEEQPLAAPNTCTLITDCADGLECQSGVCVMPATKAPLDVTLEVTPKRMPDGSQPFPILVGPFPLQGARAREFKLPVPITVSGFVHAGAEQITAQLTFVRTDAPPSLAKPIQARSSIGLLRSTFSVQLLAGEDYRVTVQPTESLTPPYTMEFTADGEEVDIDYEKIKKVTQNFLIAGAPSKVSIRARASAKDGGQVLSNTAPLASGRAMLTFAQEKMPEDYRIEIAPDQSGTTTVPASQAAGGCGSDQPQPLVPTIMIEKSAFTQTMTTKSPVTYDLTANFPALPEPVEYRGTVELCAPSKKVENLLVSMRSTALALSSMPQGVSATYSVSASAVRVDGDDVQQEFCARVIPGEYVVLVTPPATMNCEIFAEKRQVVSQINDSDLLQLRVPAKLNGKILDSEMLPIANATIDAVALGIDSTMNLADDDPTVPIYNRSRQTASNSRGAFELYVDVGVYDLIVKPPMQSGFAWQIQPGLNVGGSRNTDFTTRVELNAPALIDGTLSYANRVAKSTLAGAEVHAYIVQDDKTPTARAVEIGHTQADENGNVVLFISPTAQQPF